MGIYQTTLPDHFEPENTEKSNDTLGDEITLLAGYINAVNYKFLTLIGEFDRREAWGGAGILSCAHWLNLKCGIALGAAREKIRVARCLEKLPKLCEAFAKGSLSYSKVRAMTRVATSDNEDYLLMIAEHGTASHIEKLVRKVCRVENLAKPNIEQELEEARELNCYQDDDGMWIINAKLPPEVGSLLVKTLDEMVRRQRDDVSAEMSVSKMRDEDTFPQ